MEKKHLKNTGVQWTLSVKACYDFCYLKHHDLVTPNPNIDA